MEDKEEKKPTKEDTQKALAKAERIKANFKKKLEQDKQAEKEVGLG